MEAHGRVDGYVYGGKGLPYYHTVLSIIRGGNYGIVMVELRVMLP